MQMNYYFYTFTGLKNRELLQITTWIYLIRRLLWNFKYYISAAISEEGVQTLMLEGRQKVYARHIESLG